MDSRLPKGKANKRQPVAGSLPNGIYSMANRLSSSADTVIISVNPKAGRGPSMYRAEFLRDSLAHRGFQTFLLTDLVEVAQRANTFHTEGKLRAVVGVGGDGTAAELVNRTNPGVPVTLFPAGTANLIAKQFRYPFDHERMAAMIEDGYYISLDAGRVNGRLFLSMFSAGIDAEIVRRVHQRREENYRLQKKKGAHISYFSYLGPICSTLRSYHYPEMEMESTGDNQSTIRIKSKWAFAFNLPGYGWGVTLTPKCKGNDGSLDYCLFRRGWMIPSIFNMLMVQLGGLHRLLPGTRIGTGKSFRFESKEPVPYQLDGDFAGYTPVSIEVVPQRFTTIVPKRFADLADKSS